MATLALLWTSGLETSAGAAPVASAATEGTYVVAATWPDGPGDLPPNAWRALSGIAVDPAGRVYVADAETAWISVIEPDDTVRHFHPPQADSGLVEPHDLAVDAARGRLYVADRGAGAIAVFGLDGARLMTWPAPARLVGVAVGPDGTVYTGDPVTGDVRRFGPDGAPLAPIRAVRSVNPNIDLIVNVDVATDGTLAVLDGTEPRLHLFDRQGRRLDPLDLPAAADDVIADHNVGIYTRRWYWFATSEGLMWLDPERAAWGLNAVGSLSRVALHPPWGLAAVAPPAANPNSRVLRFNYGVEAVVAEPRAVWNGSSDAPGTLDLPIGVEVGAAGDVYVLDRFPRALWFDRDGGPRGRLERANAVGADAGPDGTIYLTDGAVVEAYTPAGVRRWRVIIDPPEAPPAAALVYDPAGDQVVVLDTVAGALRRFSPAGTPAGTVRPPPDPGGRTVWADLALGPDGRAYVLNRAAAEVVVVEPGGRATRFAVAPATRRLTVREDGVVLALGRDGWVRGYDGAGARVLAFDARREDRVAGSRPTDIGVEPSGDVFVTDGMADVVTRFTWDPAAAAARPPEDEGTCESTPGKTASPGDVPLGDPVEVRLVVQGACGAQVATVPLDVLLVVDRSGSMTGARIERARAAALDFVTSIDLAVSRMGIVAFNHLASVRVPLTADEAHLRQALGSLTAGGGTRIDLALAEANAELARAGRADARPVFILLSDGGSDSTSALFQANRAKADGVELYTINVDGNAALLSAIATSPDHYFASPGAADLGAIFDRIGERIIASALFRSIDVVDQIPANMRYVDGSAAPPAAFDPATATLRWHVEGVPFAGLVLRYRLIPLEPGDWPTNVLAWAAYVDGYSRPGRLDFPVPHVRVLAPAPSATPSPTPTDAPSATATPTASPTRTPRPTATATRTPRPSRRLYLPLALAERCVPSQRRADVMLVIDTSNSMTGANLAAARDAAGRFVGLLALPGDQVGLVTFDLDARLASPLSGDRGRIGTALAGLGATNAGTRIDRGLSRARLELLGPRARAGNTQVIVVLTDGVQNDEPALARNAATAARRFGMHVFTIGLGPDVDAGFLAALAGDPARRYLAPSTRDLAGIYDAVAGAIPCPAGAFWGGRR